MQTIKTIDLWTEQHENQYTCFNGAFVDGLEKNILPFDEYKIIKNCNCIINVNLPEIHINNKHHAIIFYKKKIPTRLIVINQKTNIEKCIDVALNQYFKNATLKKFYQEKKITFSIVDQKEKPIKKKNLTEEIDVGSCDRWKLLYNMLKGSYTETDSPYGNFTSDKYEFIPNLFIKYDLITDQEHFEIEHKCGFINTIKTRIIPIQENSNLTK